jgi:hypothetical protein
MDTVTYIRSEREKITLEKPQDIDRMWARSGARAQRFTTFIQAEGWTRVLADEIHNLRDLTSAYGLHLSCLKEVAYRLLESPNARLQSYHLVDAPKVLGVASAALLDIETPDDMKQVLEEVELYLAKVNYWIDEQIPYEACARAFEDAAVDQ